MVEAPGIEPGSKRILEKDSTRVSLMGSRRPCPDFMLRAGVSRRSFSAVIVKLRESSLILVVRPAPHEAQVAADARLETGNFGIKPQLLGCLFLRGQRLHGAHPFLSFTCRIRFAPFRTTSFEINRKGAGCAPAPSHGRDGWSMIPRSKRRTPSATRAEGPRT